MARWRKIRAVKRVVYETSAALWHENDLLEGAAAPEMKLPVSIDIHDTKGTLNWLKSFTESWMYNEKEIKVGLKESHYFANAKINGQIVGYTKIGIGHVYIYDFGLCLALPEKVAFLYHVYVSKESRKHNIAQNLIVQVMSDLADKGYQRMYCHIAKWNTSSIRLFKSLGFKCVADIRIHRIFGILRIWTYRVRQDNRLKLSLRMPSVLR